MAYLKQLKKGGVARYAIQKVALNDTFVLPRGFKIDYLWAEVGATALTGTTQLAVGSTKAVTAVTTLTFSGTATAGGAVSFTIDGVTWTTGAAGAGVTADVIADQLVATPLEGVRAVKTATNTVVLYFESAGDKTCTGTASNGISFSSVKTVTGTIGVDIVAAANVTATAKTVSKFTPVTGNEYRNTGETSDLTCYITMNNGYGVNPLKPINVYVGISKIN